MGFYKGQKLWLLETGERVTVVQRRASGTIIVEDRSGGRFGVDGEDVTDDFAAGQEAAEEHLHYAGQCNRLVCSRR